MRQRDLFDYDLTTDLFNDDCQEVVYRADPKQVREELQKVLAQAKQAERLPWTQEKLRYHQTVFPQMTRWLPEDEAAQLCFEFESELKRLLAA